MNYSTGEKGEKDKNNNKNVTKDSYARKRMEMIIMKIIMIIIIITTVAMMNIMMI